MCLRYVTAVSAYGCGNSDGSAGADELQEAVMNMKTWCDWKFEHVLVVYMLAWAVALTVTYMLSE